MSFMPPLPRKKNLNDSDIVRKLAYNVYEVSAPAFIYQGRAGCVVGRSLPYDMSREKRIAWASKEGKTVFVLGSTLNPEASPGYIRICAWD